MIKGMFERIPPLESTEQLQIGWFAISHRWLNDKESRRNTYGEIYKISSKHGSVYRNIKFSPRLKGTAKKREGQILLDWHAWITLSSTGNEKMPEELTIRRANIFEIFYFSSSHPDPAYRHSMAIARIGLYVGLLSVILAFK